MKFYFHPIVNAIIQSPLSTKYELYKQSGISDKRDFIVQLNQLIADDHLQYNFGEYWPNSLSLWVTPKTGGVYIDKIDIQYVPPRELQGLLGMTNMEYDDEEGFGFQLFIERILITDQNTGWLEKANNIHLDLDKYNYYLGAEFVNLKHLQEDKKRKLTILHLDDHWIFGEGFRKGVKDKFFPECNWHHCDHSDKAIQFVQEKFAAEEPIDLIITDINHLALDGYEFAKVVKHLESDYHNFHTPMLVVSMVSETDPRVLKGLEQGLFDQFFGKDVDPRVLGNYMMNLVDHTGFPYNGGDKCYEVLTC